MSNLHAHAVRELKILRGPNPEADSMQDLVDQCVLDIVDVFADQGHSGSSAPYVIGIVEKILRFEPVTPLTGEDSEWNEIGHDEYQNNRCSHVFKKGRDGQAYDIEGRIFYEFYTNEDGEQRKSHFINRDSRVNITFPYTPTREYINIADWGKNKNE